MVGRWFKAVQDVCLFVRFLADPVAGENEGTGHTGGSTECRTVLQTWDISDTEVDQLIMIMIMIMIMIDYEYHNHGHDYDLIWSWLIMNMIMIMIDYHWLL